SRLLLDDPEAAGPGPSRPSRPRYDDTRRPIRGGISMSGGLAILAAIVGLSADPLAPGDHTRSVTIGGQPRSHLLHVPPAYDRRRPARLVLALHPFATNGPMMARISGLSETADREGFLVAYPNGTGLGVALRWNVMRASGRGPDDVGYLAK